MTEIYDYLRLLYARVGRPHCPVCGRPIAGQSIDSIVEQILALPDGHALHGQRAGRARPQGRVPRAVRGAAQRGLHARQGRRRAAPARRAAGARQEVQAHDRGRRRPARDEGGPAHAADAVGRDRARARRGARRRSTSSTPARARTYSREASRAPSTASRCPSCSRASSRSTRRTAPARAAPASARSRRSTPTCSSPTRRSRSTTARSCRGRSATPSFYESVIQAIAERYEIPTRRAVAGARPRSEQDYFLYGTERRQGLRPVPQPDGPAALVHARRSRGSSPRSQRRYRETDSSTQRERIEEYMSFRPCPVCKGARLKPEVLAVTVGEQEHPRVHAAVGHARARVPRRRSS